MKDSPGGERLLVVDRLEGDMVVAEDDGGETLDLPRWLLPPGVREGDVLRVRTGEGAGEWRVEIRVDPEEARVRRATAKSRLERLRGRDPGGDIEL